MSPPIKFTPPFKQLVDGVAKYLAEHNVSAVVERAISPTHLKPVAGRTNRIVFYSSRPNGAAGKIVGPREPGQVLVGEDPDAPEYAVRALSDWSRTLYVSIWAQDVDRQTDEGAQDDAVFQLFSWVQRAVTAVTLGNHEWGSTDLRVPAERAYGLELLVDLTFQHSIYDVPAEIGVPDPAILKGTLP
jgi:hypothetical protein